MSASPAETPGRAMENCCDFPAMRIKSKRRCSPITNSFFPSGLGVGLRNMSGPTVSCVGSASALRDRSLLNHALLNHALLNHALLNHDVLSRKAQIFWA